MLGFIFSFLITLVGLILSIVGYNHVKDEGKSTNKTLAKAGIIISILTSALYVILFIAFLRLANISLGI